MITCRWVDKHEKLVPNELMGVEVQSKKYEAGVFLRVQRDVVSTNDVAPRLPIWYTHTHTQAGGLICGTMRSNEEIHQTCVRGASLEGGARTCFPGNFWKLDRLKTQDSMMWKQAAKSKLKNLDITQTVKLQNGLFWRRDYPMYFTVLESVTI